MDNEWKNSLRERFSDYSVPEPEGLWEGIEQGLSGKPRRKMLPVWLISGMAAAAAIALVVVLPARKATELSEPTDQDRFAQSDERFPVETGNDGDVPDGEERDVPAGRHNGDVFAVVSRHTLLSEATLADTVSVSVPEDRVPDAVTEFVSIGEASDPEKDEIIESDDKASDKTEVVPDVQEGTTTIPTTIPTKEQTFGKRFSISAYGHGGQASSEQSQGYGLNRTSEYLTRATYGSSQNDVGGVMRMLSSNRASTFDARHEGPMRMGVTVAWEAVPHMSLVSGLNWTTLHSEFEESASPVRTVTGQYLGFLGIPLHLVTDWQLWKGLWVHAGAGGMVEKGLLASSWTNTWVSGQEAESKRNPAPDSGGLFWSVSAFAGVEYRFNDFIGIYTTPGIEYHFDNGSSVRCTYTEKPLHWSLELGVRFHFEK